MFDFSVPTHESDKTNRLPSAYMALGSCFVWKMRILNIKMHTPNRISERVPAKGCDRAQE